MKNINYIYGIVGLLAGVALTNIISMNMTHEPTLRPMIREESGSILSHSGQGSMDSMMSELQSKTGDEFDETFLTQMTIHHQGAVRMADQALKNAKHQEIKDLSKAIISAQNKEIASMKEWKEKWYK